MSKQTFCALVLEGQSEEERRVLFWASLWRLYGFEPTESAPFCWPMTLEMKRALLAGMLEAHNEPLGDVRNWNENAVNDVLRQMVRKHQLKGRPEERRRNRGRKPNGRIERNLAIYSQLAPLEAEDKAKGAYHFDPKGKLRKIFSERPELKPLTLTRAYNTAEDAAYSDYRKERNDTAKRETARQSALRDDIEAFRHGLDEQSQQWVMRLMNRAFEIPNASKCGNCKCETNGCDCDASECRRCPDLPCQRADEVAELMWAQWKAVAVSVLDEQVLAEFLRLITPMRDAKIVVGKHASERTYYQDRR